ncbi:1,3-beta-glucan synthase component-domain-containing protein [Zychaea mexicana]|uniref:1,3-beta-glucan synthase component-domain-containing protein n=1 Tax=Zychaea mexicana TaxID=64656 RepID=UPI0022FDF643|nr:1,3-beta-glucan synthase component-domain-containing protein [Zychaea mexicana]KAI9495793.1 1,3-beta-glucan synthase component-domain-containing protein [Zychaea mexicana]
METMTNRQRMAQLALYLLIWGEAATLRYIPELICFIFKLADDYAGATGQEQPQLSFLDDVVSPLYTFVRDQSYQLDQGQYIRREKDHNSIIGYDDLNQFFWDRLAIAQRIRLHDGRMLKDVAPSQKYACLAQVDWDRAFRKTFYESRSWLHLLTNFSRIWIIHISIFWYYMAANVDFLYMDLGERPVKLSVIALGGLVAVLLMMAATVAEFMYLPSTSSTAKILFSRLSMLSLLAACHVGASVYVLWIDRTSFIALIVGACQLGVGAIVAILLATIPSANLFHRKRASTHLACKTFTSNFPSMTSDDRFLSILLWVCIFGCKFLETYFFLALSFRDALAATSTMDLRDCVTDPLLGKWLCQIMPTLTSILMFTVELILFFLDTYLWYVVWSTMFSVSQAFRMGISIMTSWKTLFARLPNLLYTKVLATKELGTASLRKVACSQMWNAIIIAMYREHLLSSHNLQTLLYHWRTPDDEHQHGEISSPPFFDPQNKMKKQECFPLHSEAERRLSFFAQSLATDIPVPCSVQQMPTFTVFTPHYAEKMILTLREIIREEDATTRVTLLEYLKRLHPTEWENFVKDTKFMAEEENPFHVDESKLDDAPSAAFPPSGASDKDDLPFYCIGFKSSKPEYTMRTRMWASLRAQTLYRTVSGFMNYARALKILHRIEHPELAVPDGNIKTTEEHLESVAHQKFRYLVAMQRYAKFTPEEAENCEAILREYPQLLIAYIEEEPSNTPGAPPTFYSVLIDGQCPKIEGTYRRVPRYRIRLPGNPILGDGKSDNQNHAIIFYRGEYLQLVDANQDNYLEECLKVRSIFSEFEQTAAPCEIYALRKDSPAPVAIVGAREYIFSENVGVLGDVAAGKEQTFGTLTQRIMAKTGGRLHYGHPDFLNAAFMTTRGGVSKAQRGLHLNEDIYAGMNALSRGGRIKHTEYLQCGKGRDLGFCSILNFTTKIGTGMGEQMLSREYYYLGTQLPIDRFLTFYYAHPGFHMNNIMIIFAVQLFLFCMTFVGTMATSVPSCSLHGVEENCFRMKPVFDWLERCIAAIFWVFFIAFLPLFLQELTEKGTWRSTLRLFKQFLSLSPLFEVFVNQIYANSVLSNLNFGGARYIATGRGFATARLPFSVLYARFANQSIYFGARTMFMLIFVTLTLWIPHLLYFWATVGSLVISPFVFNPHQFVLTDFITDYREFLGWLTRGNAGRYYGHAWITFCRQSRVQITGIKRRTSSQPTSSVPGPRAQLSSILASEVFMPLVQAVLCGSCYVFYKNRDPNQDLGHGGALARIACLTVGPIAWNAIFLLLLQFVSMFLAAVQSSKKVGLYMAGIGHALSLIGFVVCFELFWWLEGYAVRSTALGVLTMFAFERFVFKILVGFFLPRELHHDATNRTWWTGQWRGSNLGLQGAREYLCKVVEMSAFTTDFILGHLILFFLFPFTLVPYIDRIHSLMLFWLRPSKQIRPSVLSTKQRRRRREIALTYGPVFCLVFIFFVSLISIPPIFLNDEITGFQRGTNPLPV